MSLVTLVLLAVFIYIGVSTYTRLERDCKMSLERSLEEPMQAPGNDPGNAKDNTGNNNTSTSSNTTPGNDLAPKDNNNSREPAPINSSVVLVLKYTSDGRQIDSQKQHGIISFSEKDITSFSKTALNSKKNYGTISSYNLRYYKTTSTQGDINIAFYDESNMKSTMRGLIISFVTAGIICLFVFYIISVLLSKWCVKPIEKAWKQQQDFVADASHELKTPLTVILANTAIIKEHSAIAPSSSKNLSFIEDEAKHMSHLVNDLLFLAKTDAYRESIEKENINISDLLYNCYLSFESIAYEKGIFPETDIDENIFVNASTEKMNQLFAILLDNACKYADENGKISISLKEKNNHAVIKISNTGTIISKEQMPHLFERFYRADEARTRNGYGLGLSIADSIVKLHGGKIYAESSPEKGTTFTVELIH